MALRTAIVCFTVATVVFVTTGGTSAAAPPPAAKGSPSGCRWEYEPGKHLGLIGGHGAVWQLNFKKEEGKPYFHPVCTPADPKKFDEEFRQFAATKPPAVRKND